MPDRHLWTRHSTKTITFTCAAAAGAVGTVAVFTVTGRGLVHYTSVFCTTLLTESGVTATISYGTAGDVDAFIAMSEFSRAKHREFGFPFEMQVVPYFLPDGPEAPLAPEPAHDRPFFLFVAQPL